MSIVKGETSQEITTNSTVTMVVKLRRVGMLKKYLEEAKITRENMTVTGGDGLNPTSTFGKFVFIIIYSSGGNS